jgi:hypothetical protein
MPFFKGKRGIAAFYILGYIVHFIWFLHLCVIRIPKRVNNYEKLQ